MVEKRSIKFSEETREFWMRMYDNLANPDLNNGVRAGDRKITFDWLQNKVITFFKNNNDIYKQMILSINNGGKNGY